MRTKNLKTVISLVLFVCIGSRLFAESAVITYAKGKVEVYRNEQWVAVSIGDTVNVSETISTGFQSEAKLKYNGSVLSMGPVTRISVEELKKEPGRETVNLNLSTGLVRSKVTHTEDTRVSYKVHTPVVTASVRGTDFMVTSGGSVSCYDGAVVVFASKNERHKGGLNKSKSKSKSDEESESESESESAESDDNENNSEDVSNAAPGDYPSATATTEASEISEDAPAGSVVVGANQSSEITASGSMQKPMENAEQQSEKAKSYGQSAGEKEAVSAAGAAGAVSSSDKVAEEMQKGSISITISLPE